MENAINTLRIRNFKSIKDVTLQPRRVNLIIGQPNVGKSNVLEALSLLGGMQFDKEGGRFMDGQLRYENLQNLFYDNDWSQKIEVLANENKVSRIYKSRDSVEVQFGKIHDTGSIECFYQAMIDLSGFKYGFKILDKKVIGTVTGDIPHPDSFFVTKKYSFVKQRVYDYSRSYTDTFLQPPNGDNMLDVIQSSGKGLRKQIVELFQPYGLSLVLRTAERQFEIQKNEDGFITAIPYSLIADTLQRIIFYLAAIESNKDSVLLFEEPEAHTFPVYTTMLGQRIVESASNQFFIATHSPYLLTTIIEEMLPQGQAQDLAIFLAYYEDYQTKFYQLSDAEVLEIRRDAIDVFYNLPRYTPNQPNPYA